MGTIIKTDQAYKKIDLDPHFITIANLLFPVDPFAYHLPPECNVYQPQMIIVAEILGGARTLWKLVYPFTGIRTNHDESFILHSPDREYLEGFS